MALPYGIDIQASAFWPKEKPVIGTFVSRAHPFMEWFLPKIGVDPNTYFENVEIGKTWNDPILVDRSLVDMFSHGGKVLLCSLEQANELRKALK